MTDTSPFLRLKEERKRLKLTQAAAGTIAGVTRETWTRYEAGAVSPGMEALEAFALAGADVQYVLTGLRGSLPPSTRRGYSWTSSDVVLRIDRTTRFAFCLARKLLRVLSKHLKALANIFTDR